MDLSAYKVEVDTRMEWYRIDSMCESELGELAELLGCPYIPVNSDLNDDIRTPEQPSKYNEPVAHAAILGMLRLRGSKRPFVSQEERIVLGGLARNDRWEACLKNEDDAYAFVATLMQIYWRLQTSWGMSYAEQLHRDTVRAAVQLMLQQWLQPVEPNTAYSSRVLASAVFGEPWCALVLDSFGYMDSAADLIAASRPPFLVGLLSCKKSEEVAAELPEMAP